MKKSTIALFMGILLVSGIFGCTPLSRVATRDVPRMEPETLKARLDDPSVILIDVRLHSDFEASKAKIKGARRENNEKVATWAANYPKDKTIVLYCA